LPRACWFQATCCFSTNRAITWQVSSLTDHLAARPAPKSDVCVLFQDIEATLWLESHLSSDDSERTVVITSHDQDFLDNVVEETIYIRDQGLKYFDGTPTALQVEEKKKTRRMKTMSEAMDKKKEHVSVVSLTDSVRVVLEHVAPGIQIQQSIRQGMATAKKTGDDNR